MSVNKAIIVGRLGQNPEFKQTPGGNSVAQFSVATNEAWVDKAGQKQERTEWHRVVVWGKMAPICGQHLVKGSQVYVEGRIQTRKWQDKENQTRYTTEIVANSIQFLGANPKNMPMEKEDSFGGFQSSPDLAAPSMPESIFTEDDLPF